MGGCSEPSSACLRTSSTATSLPTTVRRHHLLHKGVPLAGLYDLQRTHCRLVRTWLCLLQAVQQLVHCALSHPVPCLQRTLTCPASPSTTSASRLLCTRSTSSRWTARRAWCAAFAGVVHSSDQNAMCMPVSCLLPVVAMNAPLSHKHGSLPHPLGTLLCACTCSWSSRQAATAGSSQRPPSRTGCCQLARCAAGATTPASATRAPRGRCRGLAPPAASGGWTQKAGPPASASAPRSTAA